MDNDKMKQQFSKDDTFQSPSGELHNAYQRPNEVTYWESPAQQQPETPEQFYQYYEMQMKKRAAHPMDEQGNQTLFDSTNAAIYTFHKKRKRRRVIGLIAVMLVLVTLGGTAYAFRDTLMNMVVQYTQSPAKYYAYVELQSLEGAVEKITPYLNINKQTSTIEATTDITLQRDALDSLMQSTFGTSLSDLESYLGLSPEHIGFHVISDSDITRSNNQVGLRINKKDILTLEFFTDMIKKEALFRVPELSQAYIRQSLDSTDNPFKPDNNSFDFMTPERNADLLKRYSKIIIENLSNVEIEKNTELTLNSLSVPCNKITVTVTGEDINNIAMALLREAREDQYLHKFLPSFDLSLEEFQATIDESLENLESTENTDSLQMLVYVNKEGKIIGREIGIASSHAAIGYSYLDKEHIERYNLFVKRNNGDYILEINGSQSKDKDGYDGSMEIMVSSNPELSSATTFDVTYQDARTEKVGNRLYYYGSYILSSLKMNGLQVLIDNSAENQVQTNKLTLQLGASPLVIIDTKLNYDSEYQIAPPTEDAVIFESTELDSYLATIDMETFLHTLSDRLGVDLSWLLPYLSDLSME